jgi:hypothetical protein
VRLSTAAKNTMLDTLDESAAVGAKYGSLHSAYSATGANELTGGTPAYARKALVWAAASGAAKATSAAALFDVPNGSFVRFIGFWDSPTGGVFLGMTPNGGGLVQAFVVPDATNDTLECVAHGLIDGETVVVWAVPGDPLPSPLVEGTVYYVVSSSIDDLKLSATFGGAAIDLSAIGAGELQKIVPEQYAAQGSHTVTSVTINLD